MTPMTRRSSCTPPCQVPSNERHQPRLPPNRAPPVRTPPNRPPPNRAPPARPAPSSKAPPNRAPPNRAPPNRAPPNRVPPNRSPSTRTPPNRETPSSPLPARSPCGATANGSPRSIRSRSPPCLSARKNLRAAELRRQSQGNFTCRSPLPRLADTAQEEQGQLFLQKLEQCRVLFDFDDPLSNLREKEVKRACLSELIEYIAKGRNVLCASSYQHITDTVK
jgi:hypothetical protein